METHRQLKKKLTVTFAPIYENAPVLKFTVSWPLGYERRNSKVKPSWERAEDHVFF